MRTKATFLALFFAVAAISPASAYTERDLLQKAADLAKLKETLIPGRKWAVYPDYADRAGWDKLLGGWKSEYVERGEKRLGYEWVVVKATDYMEFERSGNRRIMEDPFGSNNSALADLVMAELAEGKGRFLNQIINGVYHTCEMTSWALSAHVILQPSRRALPEAGADVFDLTAGDVGMMLSWTHYFLHSEFDKVDPSISRRLRAELQRRILDAYMTGPSLWWMAEPYKPGAMVNNWNPWCNSNALMCFMLLEDDMDKYAAGVYKTMVSVDKFINYTNSDGACEEGPSYWGHAAGKMYDYLQMLSDATGGKVNIFDEPIIKNMGEYISRSYAGGGWVVNFADASAREKMDAPLVYRYGKAVGSAEMMGFAVRLERSGGGKKAPSGRDINRTLQTCLNKDEFEQATPEYAAPSCTWYPETEFCYMKDKNGLMLAAKGGYNNESHNHNDAGSFILYKNNTPIIIDVGVGTYTRQTFSSERYSIWTMQSDYHNLPKINGVSQKFGSEYKATGVSFNPGRMTFAADLAKAYPEEAQVKRWVRSYTLSGGALKISDSFSLAAAAAKNQINFMAWGDVDAGNPGVVSIDVKGNKMSLFYDKKVFSATVETVDLTDKRLSNVWGGKVCRITLTAKSDALSGKYSYTIK